MPATPHRLVVDTNVLLRGLINIRSTSGRVLNACDARSVVIVLSNAALSEYRAVLTDPVVVGPYPELTRRKVELVLRRLRYVGDVIRSVGVRFEFPRDPKDAKWIELAIAGRATHIISVDNDLLSLSTGRGDASKRFRQRLPGVDVIEPGEFLRRHAQELGV